MHWLEIVLTFVGGVIATAGVAWIKGFWEARKAVAGKSYKLSEKLAAAQKINTELAALVHHAGCSQAVVLTAENGTRLPGRRGIFRGSVMFEASSQPKYNVGNRWIEQVLDRSYVDMLVDLIGARRITLRFDQLPEGALRDIYSRNEVLHSEVVLLEEREDSIVYLSVNFQKLDEFGPVTRDEIRSAAGRIVQHLKDL